MKLGFRVACMITILAGGYLLVTPAPASAQPECLNTSCSGPTTCDWWPTAQCGFRWDQSGEVYCVVKYCVGQ